MSQPEQTSDDAVIGRAFRASLLVIFLICAIVLGGIWMTRNKDTTQVEASKEVALPQTRDTSKVTLPTIPFADITEQSGIDFIHYNGATGEKLLPETMGGGCAFLDYDNDGDQDALLLNSRRWPWDPKADGDTTQVLRLYDNDGTGRFQDVSSAAGLDVQVYGMGIAIGDYDNNGYVDIFVTAVGSNRLLRNDGGKFTDVTDEMKVGGADDEWSTGCAWLDFDNDGDLDLFVCNYVRWSRDIDLAQNFQLTGIGRAYGPPTAFEGTHPYLYRNDGDLFTDVSESSQVRQINPATNVPLAKSLAVAPVDLDQDGWLDLIVANDTVRNLLFHNQRDGTFREIGVHAGIAFDSQGKARGAMGIDSAHFRNDDCVGVAVGNFANEMTALYVCDGTALLFTDDAIPTGLGPPTRLDLSFGLCFVDVDLDGRLDILAANGHLETEINTVQSSQHYEQPSRLFWNAGSNSSTEFIPLTADQLGAEFGKPIVGRGATYADIDHDGDLDFLLTQIGGRPLLLRNDQELNHAFIRLKLIGQSCNRDAIGARVEVECGDAKLVRQVMPTRSYLSQSELPVTIGLGNGQQVERVVIQWPDGSRQIVDDVQINGLTVVEQNLTTDSAAVVRRATKGIAQSRTSTPHPFNTSP